jgi:hypothetical protein
MKLRRSLAVPLATALTAGLSIPALATGTLAANGDTPAGTTVAIHAIDDSNGDDDAAFSAAWGSTSATLYTGESPDDGTVGFAAGGGLTFTTTDNVDSQAFGLIPVHVKLADVTTEPSLAADRTGLGLQLRGDVDGDGTYDAPDYFTLVQYGPDDWQLSKASGSVSKAADLGPGRRSLSDWQTALPSASVQDVGASLGSNAPDEEATLTSLTFAGATYTFAPLSDFSLTRTSITGSSVVGGTLAADHGGRDPAPTARKYVWHVVGETTVLGTGSTYVPAAGDLGKQLAVTVTGSTDGYAPTTVTSDAVTVSVGTLTSTKTPAITGTAKDGQKLTVSNGNWSPAATSYTYQWLRTTTNGSTTKIGTNSSSYTLVAADNGQKISATVTAHRAGYTDLPKSSGTVTVGAGSLTTATPTISGTAKVASTLTARPGTWTSGAKLAYQWKRNGSAINGATKSTYVLGSADRGTKITVAVTGTLSGYTKITKTSASTATIAYGTFTKATTPSISGTVRVGNTVKASAGTWSPAATFSYQWKVSGKSVKGATHSTYTPSASYRGKKLTVTVTAKRTGYTTVTRTSSSKTIGYGVLSAPKPKISGTHQTGKTLKVSVGTWKPKPSFSYQWKRNGSKIKGATHTSYKTTSADRGKKITVTVTGKKSGYATKSATSSATSVTAPFNRTYAPTITGTTRVYSTLTAHVKTWSPKPKVSYQWKRDGKSISGATHSTYKLLAADYHHRITVTATGRRSTYTTASRTSAKSASIAAPKATLTKDGTYKVGTQIAPGTYVSSAGAEGCYWERRSSSGSSFSGIIANDFADGQQIVTVTSKDKYFKTNDCGTWTRFVALGGARTSIPGDGTYAVNSQLKPGTYRTSGPAAGSYGCYWEVDSDFLGQISSIIDNGNEDGSAYVTIYSSDTGFRTSGCATWKRVSG